LRTGCRDKRVETQNETGAREETPAAGRSLQRRPGGHPFGTQERTLPASGRRQAQPAPEDRQQQAVQDDGRTRSLSACSEREDRRRCDGGDDTVVWILQNVTLLESNVLQNMIFFVNIYSVNFDRSLHFVRY
jgi:hypothetical protein